MSLSASQAKEPKTIQPDARLPEGMRRVGYDADTQTYTFEDHDGSLWKGSPGAQYGVLKRAQTAIDDHRFWRRDSATSATSASSDKDDTGADRPSFPPVGRRFTDFDGLPSEYVVRGEDQSRKNTATATAKVKAEAVGMKFTQLKRTPD